MPVRPSFNIDKESWLRFKKLIPEFEPALEKFASEDAPMYPAVARISFLLNLFTDFDLELDVYLNPGPRKTLTKERLIEFNKEFRPAREKEENKKYLEDFDKNKLRKMPPVSSKNKEDMIELICYAFPNIIRNEYELYTNSFYEVMEMKEWFRQYGIKNEFYYLPEDNLHAYLIKLV